MNRLKERLAAAVNEARFDFEYDDVRGDGSTKRQSHHDLSTPEFASMYASQRHRMGNKSAYSRVPDGAMCRLVEEVRSALADFIDPETDRIGHAFPIDKCSVIRNSGGERGITQLEFESTPENFSESLLRAAAIIGADVATKLLSDWKHGRPLRFKTSTIANGLVLDKRYSPRDDIQIVALPLTTTELPRLPRRSRRRPADYLGRTLLSLKLSAFPVLFRPKPGKNGGTVKTRTIEGVDFDILCEALSLQVNSHVSTTFLWTEQAEAAPFSLGDWGTMGDDNLDHFFWKSQSLEPGSGVMRIEHLDDASMPQLDETELLHVIQTLLGSDNKLRIVVDRWKRSMRRHNPATDSYIDLRIALETLYLKDFLNENSTEMRFRLSLFGAWHLGATLEKRREIRKILRDAYDKASGAVHGGEVSDDSSCTLRQAQQLCRQGILKLLREGPPDDWGDMILGAGH